MMKRFDLKPLLLTTLLTTLPFSSFAEKGGQDGGGGNINVGQPISTEQVSAAVAESTQYVIPYLRIWERAFRKQLPPNTDGYNATIAQKLFSRPSILEVVTNTKVIVLQSSPCADSNGSETDGSIHTGSAYSICISALRVSRKVMQGQQAVKVSSLILHELSHLKGLTEEEATQLQLSFEAAFRFVSPEAARAIEVEKIQDSPTELRRYFEPSYTIQRISQKWGACMFTERAQEKLSEIFFAALENSFGSRLSFDDREEFSSNLTKMFALVDYACANDTVESAERIEINREEIRKGFAGKLSVRSDEYCRNTMLNATPQQASHLCQNDRPVTIKKIVNSNALRSEVQDIFNYFTSIPGKTSVLPLQVEVR